MKWCKRSPLFGEGFVGAVNAHTGRPLFGHMADWYHGAIVCHGRIRFFYWRRSLWLFGRPIVTWKQPTKVRSAVEQREGRHVRTAT